MRRRRWPSPGCPRMRSTQAARCFAASSGPIVLHGAYAYLEHVYLGLDHRLHCGILDVRLAGIEPAAGVHLVGIARPAWRALGWTPPIYLGGIGVTHAAEVLWPTRGLPPPDGSVYPPPAIAPLPMRTVAIDADRAGRPCADRRLPLRAVDDSAASRGQRQRDRARAAGARRRRGGLCVPRMRWRRGGRVADLDRLVGAGAGRRRHDRAAATRMSACAGAAPGTHSLARCMAMLCLVALVAACSEEPTRPDLGRLYRVGDIDTTPVIVIPGVFGSRAARPGQRRRSLAGTSNDILFGEYRNIALDFDPVTLQVRSDKLEAYGIAETALGRDFYGQIIDTLRRFGGYVPGTPGTRGAAGRAPLLHLSVRLAAGQRRSGARARSPDRSDSPRLRESVVAGRHRRAQHGRPDRALLPALRHRRRARRQRAAGHALRHDTRAQAGAARNAEHGLGLVAARLPDRRAGRTQADSAGSAGDAAFRLPAVPAPAGHLADRHHRRAARRRTIRRSDLAPLSLVDLRSRGRGADPRCARRRRRRVYRGAATLFRLPARARSPVHVGAVDAGAGHADPLCAVRRRLHADAGAPCAGVRNRNPGRAPVPGRHTPVRLRAFATTS